MLTPRGWWFFLLAVALLALALLGHAAQPVYIQRANTSLALVALTLLVWFGAEWGLFAYRALVLTRLVQIRREVRDDRGPVDTLWAGRKFHVVVEVGLPEGAVGLPYVKAGDLGPFGTRCESGDTGYEGPVEPGKPVRIQYRVNCAATGKVRFEGLTFRLADLQGFFYHVTFLPAPAEFRVLPPLADIEGHGPTVKRTNLLPPPGIHRFPRPGSGTELLDFRDYLPGDPPRTIAWKISARRDRLITKEFESEVPVRCTFFVDTSNSVRLGPPGYNALTRLVEIAAGAAQAASGARDLTGLCLFDEETSTHVRPARGARHLARLLNLLTDAAGLKPTTGRADVRELLPLAHGFARTVYPHLMRPTLNRAPSWLPWLWPQPAWTIARPTMADRVFERLLLLTAGYGLVGLVVLWLAILGFAWVVYAVWAFVLPWLPAWSGLIVFACIVLGLILFYVRGPLAWFFPRRRRLYRWRKQLAAVLSVLYGLAPGGLGLLLEDDEQFNLYVQRFLGDHHVPYTLPRYDRRGQYLFASAGKVEVLARALLRAVARGHDNELFVLLADFLELGDQWDPVLKAVKVALARHHQVMVVCPWPPEIEEPDGRGRRPGSGGNGEPASAEGAADERNDEERTAVRLHRQFHRMRRALAALGVPVVCAKGGEPTQFILDRLDQLRGLGRRR